LRSSGGVTDLAASAGAKPGTIELHFDAPDGRARRWVVQAAPLPIVARRGDGKSSVSVFGATPLAVAAARTGRAQSVVVTPGEGERFFVVRGESEDGALAPLSNVATSP
jgi:hypothetical protein